MTDRIPIQEGRKILQAQASEAQIQSAIADYLRAQRIPHSITDATQSFNNKGQRVRRVNSGWPDITGCFRGLMLCCEVKSAKGRLRPDQAATLHALYQAGALVVIARSIEDLVATLDAGQASPETLAEITATLAKEGNRKRRGRANKK